MPERDHSAQARAGVLVTGRDSEAAGLQPEGKTCGICLVYTRILLWHIACQHLHDWFYCPSESKTEWGIGDLNSLAIRAFTQLHRSGRLALKEDLDDSSLWSDDSR